MIKVSVIIPIYNDEKYLRSCLESVVRQSLKEIEIICINDGSTDQTGFILEEYQKIWDNIVVYTQENQGVSSARNKGIQFAKGEYLAFMDGDDYYPDNEVLECLYTTAKKEQVDICGGSYVLDKNGIREQSTDKLQYFENSGRLVFDDYAFPFGFTRFIYSKELLRQKEIKFPPIRLFEDPPFLMQAMIEAEVFYAVNKVVYCYRVGIHQSEYSYEDAINALNAMQQMILLTKKRQSVKLQVNCMKLLYTRFIDNILPHYRPEDKYFIEPLKEIQHCVLEDAEVQLSEIRKYFTPQGIEVYIDELEKELCVFRNNIDNFSKVIVYGAGMVGKFVVELMESVCGKKPYGIAVTKLREETQYLSGIEVTDIRSWKTYKEDALFIVAVVQNRAWEMLHVLEEMGVRNIYVVDYLKLSCYVKRRKIAGINRCG